MNIKALKRWMRFELHCAKRCIPLLIFRSHERRDFRNIRRIHSDADIVGRWVSYEPRSRHTWPFVAASEMGSRERIIAALEAAKPSTVLMMRER